MLSPLICVAFLLFTTARCQPIPTSPETLAPEPSSSEASPTSTDAIEEEEPTDLTLEKLTSGCYQNGFGCIFPDPECEKRGNCTSVISYRSVTDYYLFVISAPLKSATEGYIAIGFSEDKVMGNDFVVECVINDTEVGVFQSWNHNSGFKNSRIPNSMCPIQEGLANKGLKNCSVAAVNGQIFCSFARYQIVAHDFMNIGRNDFTLNHYYVLLVTGKEITKDNIGKHDSIVFISPLPTNFDILKQDYTLNTGRASVHAYLMSTVWSFIVPISIYSVRYMKETFTSCFGRKAWFVMHATLMILGFVAQLVSVAFITWHRTRFDSKWPTLPSGIRHAQRGVVATTLFFFQVTVVGWYRPTGRSRKTFSGLHSLFGVIAAGLATWNIAFSAELDPGMPCYVKYIMLGAVFWHLLMHGLMTLHFKWLDAKLGLKKCRALSPYPIKVMLTEAAPGSKLRIKLFIVYVLGCGGFAVGFCMAYVMRGNGCPCKDDSCRKVEDD